MLCVLDRVVHALRCTAAAILWVCGRATGPNVDSKWQGAASVRSPPWRSRVPTLCRGPLAAGTQASLPHLSCVSGWLLRLCQHGRRRQTMSGDRAEAGVRSSTDAVREKRGSGRKALTSVFPRRHHSSSQHHLPQPLTLDAPRRTPGGARRLRRCAVRCRPGGLRPDAGWSGRK